MVFGTPSLAAILTGGMSALRNEMILKYESLLFVLGVLSRVLLFVLLGAAGSAASAIDMGVDFMLFLTGSFLFLPDPGGHGEVSPAIRKEFVQGEYESASINSFLLGYPKLLYKD